MRRRMRTAALALLAAAIAVAAGAVATGAAPFGSGPALSDVPTANTKSDGYSPASKLSVELSQVAVAQGSTKLDGGTAQVSYYGYDNDVVNAAGQPQMVPTQTVSNEAHKTEPDKNTYLVFKRGLTGADPSYDYGTHFLFQGHEAGTPGYITRINLDADAAHRVTLLATADATGAPLADIDGSTWDPWAKRLASCSQPRMRTRPPTRRPPATPRSSRTSQGPSAGAGTKASRTTATGTSGSSKTSAARAQAAGERRLPPGLALRGVLLRRDRRHERDQRRERGRRRLGLDLPAEAA
jgi:hypothetical protein